MLDIRKVLSVPEPAQGTGLYVPNTLYLVSGAGQETFDLYITNASGTEIRRAPTQRDLYDGLIHMSDSAPATTIPQKFWYDTVNLVLYIKYDDGEGIDWVEAIPTYSVLEFAGTGEAGTMARSDHDHDLVYVKIGAMEW